jgi:hypothetical protein
MTPRYHFDADGGERLTRDKGGRRVLKATLNLVVERLT